MTPRELLEFADRVAADLLTIGRDQQIPAKDLMMVVMLAQKILQTILLRDDHMLVNDAAQESEATYQAASSILELN